VEGREVDLLAHGAGEIGVQLDGSTLAALVAFLDRLAEWNARIRLTGERSPEALVKHVLDSLAVVPHLPAHGLVVDIGAGGGFPGIVLAIARPDLRFVLLDARRRAVSFLRETARMLPLANVQAIHRRAEEVVGDLGGRAAAVVSRALRLDDFLALAAPLLADGGVILAMQTPGRASAARSWATAASLELVEEHAYAVPGAGSRALVVFRRIPPP
jgi:16S rRNA (guanine527-N7)-methyltransferase